MRILWLNWKDSSHPLAGGAEVVNEALAKRLVQAGHEVTFLVSGIAHAPAKVISDGFRIIRIGSRLSVYWHAYRYYKKQLYNWPDVVIDEVNTIPFFAKLYAKQKNVLFVHQLCRQVWWYQMPFPLSLAGYVLEPLYLRLLSDRNVVTVSASTKADLVSMGFAPQNIHIISEGITIDPITEAELSLLFMKKTAEPVILTIGRVEPMKRTVDIVRAFEITKKTIPAARLVIAGLLRGPYGRLVQKVCANSPFASSIVVLGTVSKERKVELLRHASVLAVASVKEGWGLVVTEAASQGTPAAAYNADGLRDSIKDGVTGVLAKVNSPQGLAEALVKALDPSVNQTLGKAAWEWSKKITFERSTEQLDSLLRQL